jgi:hypothetical protein
VFLKAPALLFLSSLAVGAVALEVTPDFFPFRGTPGSRLKAQVALVNDSTAPVRVDLEVHAKGEGPEKAWLAVSPSSLRIAPGRRRVADLKVRVPDTAGELNAEIWARLQGPVEWTEIRQVRRVRLVIQGTEVYRLVMDSAVGRESGGLILVDVVFRNAGNVSVRPSFGAELVLEGGERASAPRHAIHPAVLPGGRGVAQIEVPSSKARWTGEGMVTAYFRNSAGETRQEQRRIEK